MGFVTEEEMAEEIARKSRNPDEGAHPLHIHDETARRRQFGSPSDVAEEPWNPEERSENGPDTPMSYDRNEPTVGKQKRRGGGINVADAYTEDNPAGGNFDTEMGHLVREYNSRNKEDTRTFDEWRRELAIPGREVHKKVGPNTSWVRRIMLDKVGYGTGLYDKLADLATVWTSPNTEVTYKVGGSRESDKIIFKNPALRARFEKDTHETSLTLEELKTALKESEINLSIARPHGPEDKRFIEDLKHLKLGNGILRGSKVNVEFTKEASEKQRLYSEYFNLNLNPKMLEKYTTEEEKGDVENFLGVLKHTEVGWWGFEESKNKQGPKEITGVSVISKNGEKATLKSHTFRKIFENVLPYKNKDGSVGYTFIVPGGKRKNVYPGMKHEELVITGKELKIDGKELPQDTIYYI